jgi:hypothetical protein
MAGYQDLFLNQGESFTTQMTLNDSYGNAYNLTSFSVMSQAKTSYYSSNASIVFNSTVFDAANGIIQLSANAAVTANVSPRQKLVYDVIIIDSANTVTRVLEGQILVSPAVTLA